MIGLDSNVLLYYEGVDDEPRRELAHSVVLALESEGLVIPAQALGEFHRVVTGKTGWPGDRAVAALRRWMTVGVVVPTTAAIVAEAAELHDSSGFRIWDAVIVCAAESLGSDLLLSEDMQDGFVYRGMTIVNPFAPTPHPRLAARLKQAS